MDKLLVVDGSNLLFQMFYGMPSRIFNKDGKPIHGTLGFVGALLKLLRTVAPTHAVVVFDGETHNERVDIDPDYKANRPDYSTMAEEETPFSQLPDIYAALKLLGIPYAETTVCETDDVIASYAFAYGKDRQIYISSFDSDFFQLVNENVRILRYRGENTAVCDEAYLKNKLGISPKLYADYKALTGDNADNIKGAKGVGPKTAAALINEFGNLRSVLDNAERIKKPSVKNAVCEAKERLEHNLRLIKLNDGAPLPFPLAELRYIPLDLTTSQVLKEIGLK